MKRILLGLSFLSMLALGTSSAVASTTNATAPQSSSTTVQTKAPATKTLSYEEEGMTVKKAANLFTSKLGYRIYVFPEYRHSTSGAYDVFTMKGDPNACFSIGRLKSNRNFTELAAPLKKQLSALGTVSVSNAHGTLTLMATSLQKHVSEEYVFTTMNGEYFRFHIVHESDWESQAPFFAMFKSIV